MQKNPVEGNLYRVFFNRARKVISAALDSRRISLPKKK